MAHSLPLQGKVAVVTGASSGIGEAISKRLAEAGAKVMMGARRTDRLAALQKEIESAGGSAAFKETDVVSRDQVVGLVKAAQDTFGPVDIMVNNAGVMLLSPVTAFLQDEWERMLDVNVKGVLNGVAAVLPSMLERGTGDIINISSDAGRKLFPNGAIYCASKWALEAITQGLRSEVAGKGVRVTSIQPGVTHSELATHTTHEETKQMGAAFSKAIRFLDADDVARAVVYATSQPLHCAINEILQVQLSFRVPDVVELPLWQDKRLLFFLMELFGPRSLEVIVGDALPFELTHLVGGDEVGVDVERGSAKAATKDAVQVKHEARTNLYERTLLLFILHDLVVSEPYFLVHNGKVEDVVDERFALAVAFWRAKNLHEKLLDENPVRLLSKGFVKGQNGP
jgi:NADP-dependent 3-hydroxy acid dehydrogenase YdfG